MNTQPQSPRILVSELLRGYDNIFHCWNDVMRKPLTREEILGYSGGIEVLKPYKIDKSKLGSPSVREDHIKRVRYFMANIDNCEPVLMHQTIYDRVILWDGHHRLLAAVMLGVESLPIKWRGIWSDVLAQFPESHKAGLLSSPTNELYWPGIKSYEKRLIENKARDARRAARSALARNIGAA